MGFLHRRKVRLLNDFAWHFARQIELRVNSDRAVKRIELGVGTIVVVVRGKADNRTMRYDIYESAQLAAERLLARWPDLLYPRPIGNGMSLVVMGFQRELGEDPDMVGLILTASQDGRYVRWRHNGYSGAVPMQQSMSDAVKRDYATAVLAAFRNG